MQTVELISVVAILSLAALLNGVVLAYILLRAVEALFWRTRPASLTRQRELALAQR